MSSKHIFEFNSESPIRSADEADKAFRANGNSPVVRSTVRGSAKSWKSLEDLRCAFDPSMINRLHVRTDSRLIALCYGLTALAQNGIISCTVAAMSAQTGISKSDMKASVYRAAKIGWIDAEVDGNEIHITGAASRVFRPARYFRCSVRKIADASESVLRAWFMFATTSVMKNKNFQQVFKIDQAAKLLAVSPDAVVDTLEAGLRYAEQDFECFNPGFSADNAAVVVSCPRKPVDRDVFVGALTFPEYVPNMRTLAIHDGVLDGKRLTVNARVVTQVMAHMAKGFGIQDAYPALRGLWLTALDAALNGHSVGLPFDGQDLIQAIREQGTNAAFALFSLAIGQASYVNQSENAIRFTVRASEVAEIEDRRISRIQGMRGSKGCQIIGHDGNGRFITATQFARLRAQVLAYIGDDLPIRIAACHNLRAKWHIGDVFGVIEHQPAEVLEIDPVIHEAASAANDDVTFSTDDDIVPHIETALATAEPAVANLIRPVVNDVVQSLTKLPADYLRQYARQALQSSPGSAMADLAKAAVSRMAANKQAKTPYDIHQIISKFNDLPYEMTYGMEMHEFIGSAIGFAYEQSFAEIQLAA